MPPKTPDAKRARARLLGAARKRKRASELDAIAHAAGYPNFDRFATLAKRGVVQLPECPAEERVK